MPGTDIRRLNEHITPYIELLTNFLKIYERESHQEGCGKGPKMQLNALEGYKDYVFTHTSNFQYSSENLQFKFGERIHFIQWLRI